MERVAILLAVYNGRQWIDEQLQSILEQKNVGLDVYISVDLSDDGSYEHLVTTYSHLPNIHILDYGKRYGSAGSNFYRLVLDSPIDKYDYVSFCDQDDVWFDNKIQRAIKMIEQKHVDAYSGNVVAFWENGKECLISKSQPQVEYDFLFEAAGPGCTYVFKRSLACDFKQFLLNSTDAVNVALHDWLLYSFSRVNNYTWYIDDVPFMKYRQHASNQVGANNSIKAGFKRLKLAKCGWYKNEVNKLCVVLKFENDPIVDMIKRNDFKRTLLMLLNITKFRRRFRDRLMLAVFILLRWV
ncbi:glycosyltransferase [Buttiauxella selenatireducens]|uniref:Glycosyltransferase n=1 Tax=Buttiauxella selenatireducens TaxID=3073902 RepID=A0ABY9SEF5_9ENTR|nr:glycosyltransferase [Buttiauxella sp. R73]WMY75886.1 glycosyltransferase [Buttiauxella sp. R73]